MANFKNPWGKGGVNFPTHLNETFDRWFKYGGNQTSDKQQHKVNQSDCIWPLSETASELYVDKIVAKFNEKTIDQGTVVQLYDELKSYMGTSFSSPDRMCCGTLNRFFIFPYINGENQEEIVYPVENIEGTLGIAANGRIENNKNENLITFYFGIDECSV